LDEIHLPHSRYAQQQRRARHAPKTTIPINRFTVRSFITNVTDGAKLKPGSTTLKGIAFDGGQASRKSPSRSTRQDMDAAKLGKDLGKYSSGMALPVKACSGHLGAQGARHQTMPATPSRWTPCGIRRAICATSSKPFASPRPEEK